MSKTIQNARKLAGGTLLVALVLALLATSASAATLRWQLHTSAPDTVPAGKKTFVVAWLVNTGEVPLTGSVTVTDSFPAGISLVGRPAQSRTADRTANQDLLRPQLRL